MGTNAKSQRYAERASRFGGGLIYHRDPFPEETEITGYAKLVVWIAMDVPDTDFMVTLHEVLPDGTSIQLTDDALCSRYRESPRQQKPVTPGIGYRSGSSVTRAVARVELGNERLQQTATKLERKLH